MINKLVSEIKKKDAPIVVGLDPMLKYIPDFIKDKNFKEFGANPKGASEAVFEYNKGIVDAVYDLVPAVKPQIAMYEQFGIEGLIAFKRTVDYCKEKGLVVIGDIKRGDIGSTSEAYAVGHLSSVEIGGKFYEGFGEDFATVKSESLAIGIHEFGGKHLGFVGMGAIAKEVAKRLKGWNVKMGYYDTFLALTHILLPTKD